MSFWKTLFGGGSGEPRAKGDGALAREEYKGYTIKAVAMQSGSEHQLAGAVEKAGEDGEVKVHNFVRADKFGSRDDAVAASLGKARQLVDEQGDALFR